MKKIIILLLLVAVNYSLLLAQTTQVKYPTPEFSNEIYFFNKESSSAVRLEKGYSKQESSSKMGGMGGTNMGYSLEGSKSDVRIPYGNLSFIFYIGEAPSNNSEASDSMMRANGIDPSAMADPTAMMNDPARTTALYSMSIDKGNRNIITMAFSGMKILGKNKKESTKYTISIRNVKKGYYELIVDKPLPRGEYAFVVQDMTGGMDNKSKLFAFGVD
ncbi:MAG: hypothetical protein ACXWCG_11330 [Flavitalea sp.]